MTPNRALMTRVPWWPAGPGAAALSLVIAACGQTYLDGILPLDASGPSGGAASGAATCEDGRARCDHACSPLAKDPENCGQCGRTCAAKTVCSQSACASECAAELTECEGACVDLLADRDDCGACGHACTGGSSCTDGACACAGNLSYCNGLCVNTKNNPQHCGGCANACAQGKACINGMCT
jgi:hypothetical protein